MNTANEIRERCEKEIAELQQVCKHPKKQWMMYAWAPGHYNGEICLVCLVCSKELERKNLPDDWCSFKNLPPKYIEYVYKENEALRSAIIQS